MQDSSSFVFVDPIEGSIKLISSIMEAEMTDDFTAIGIGIEGDLELLTTEE